MSGQHLALGLVLLLAILAIVAPFEIGLVLMLCAIAIYLFILWS
jgi:hypothetical protein